MLEANNHLPVKCYFLLCTARMRAHTHTHSHALLEAITFGTYNCSDLSGTLLVRLRFPVQDADEIVTGKTSLTHTHGRIVNSWWAWQRARHDKKTWYCRLCGKHDNMFFKLSVELVTHAQQTKSPAREGLSRSTSQQMFQIVLRDFHWQTCQILVFFLFSSFFLTDKVTTNLSHKACFN